MSTGTVRLQRVLRAAPERIYRAFLEADAMAKWLPPYGFTCKVHHLDARVRGSFRMTFSNFGTGGSHSFGGEYLELVPNERIRYTDKFDDPNLPGVIQVAVNLRKVRCGTEIQIVQEGIPEVSFRMMAWCAAVVASFAASVVPSSHVRQQRGQLSR